MIMEKASRILLVDDELNILNVLSDMLREKDCYVRTATRPDEALRLIEEEPFHIAFVDNFLGPIEGIQLIEQMSRIDPSLHFVIMTGNPSIDLAIDSLKKGVADFLRKPFRAEDILISIDHVNRKRELEQQRRELMNVLECKVQEKTDELKQIYLSVLVALSRTVENKDLGTYGHSMRVSHISGRIAERLALSAREVDDIKAASLLHDIGKVGISDSILAKQGPLSEEEFGIIRCHTHKGVEILQPLKQFEALLPAILYHHERYDGSGYPAGLSGDAIPLSARIIAVADTYDAILSDRPYRLAATHDNAMQELRAWSGKQFDARVVSAFDHIMQEEKGNAAFARIA
jgi:putative nucleotidyltransferase with HDIG domain